MASSMVDQIGGKVFSTSDRFPISKGAFSAHGCRRRVVNSTSMAKGSCSFALRANSYYKRHEGALNDTIPSNEAAAPNKAFHRTQSRCGGLSFEGFLLGSPSQMRSGSGDCWRWAA